MAAIGQVSVGTTATRLVSSSTPVASGVNLRTASAVVYVGTSSAVTTSTGYLVPANTDDFYPKDLFPDATNLWLISSSAAQAVGYKIL